MYIRKYKTHVFGILVTQPLSKTRQVVLCSNGSNCQLGVSLKLIGDKKKIIKGQERPTFFITRFLYRPKGN